MIEEIGDSVRYLHAARDIFRSAKEPFAVHLTSMALCEAERLLQREYEKWSNRAGHAACAYPEAPHTTHGKPITKNTLPTGA